MPEIKVSKLSRSASVAGCIAAMVREGKTPVVRAVGIYAVSKAVRAVAYARNYLESDGIQINCVPTVAIITGNGTDAGMEITSLTIGLL